LLCARTGTVLRGYEAWRTPVRSTSHYDIAANRFLLIGCIGVVALIAAWLVAAVH